MDIRLGNIEFSSLSHKDKNMLINTFIKIEIREAMWNCESTKIPDPNYYNLVLISTYGKL